MKKEIDINEMSLSDLVLLKSLLETKLETMRAWRDGARGFRLSEYTQRDKEIYDSGIEERINRINARIEDFYNI